MYAFLDLCIDSWTDQQKSQQQLSQIEKSVTHLLVATKQLLETLTQWSRGSATETEVSDVYVRLGYEFNIACRAFSAIGVDTSDLGPVPDMLRSILEETLSQDASQASLDRFLPRIRDIIINLLQGLKKKQQRLRHKTPRESSTSSASGAGTRQTSTISTSDIFEEAGSRQSSRISPTQKVEGNGIIRHEDTLRGTQLTVAASGSTIHRQDSVGSMAERLRRGSENHEDDVPTDLPVLQNSFQSPMPMDVSAAPIMGGQQNAPPARDLPRDLPIPRPQKQQDALAALQRGGDLERRASRRFSQYQIQKHLGGSNTLATIPSAQRSPIPNRGRHTPDSSTSAPPRSTYLTYQAGSPKQSTGDSASLRNPAQRVGNDGLDSSVPHLDKSKESVVPNNLLMQTPEDQSDRSLIDDAAAVKRKSVGVSPTRDSFPQVTSSGQVIEMRNQHKTSTALDSANSAELTNSNDLTIFLQFRNRMKKFVLNDAAENLSLARLQLAFIEKFSWNTHSNGVELPEIYIQDARTGTRYELEDLSDIKNDSILVLNVDALDEVKRHVDTSVAGLRNLIDNVRTAVNEQQIVMQRVSDGQQEATKEIARMATAPPPLSHAAVSQERPVLSVHRGSASQLDEVQSLRRELAVMRQTYSSQVSSMENAMSKLRERAATIKSVAVTATNPTLDIDSGRSQVNQGKKTLSEDSEKIISRVDDLQDTVEDLRKDVVTRGVRPLPRQLETVSKEISAATAELKRLKEFMRREKPIWTKLGEAELKMVCDDQNLLSMQEELAADLEDDLEKAAQTFALVEEATRQQNIQNGTATPTRSTSRTLPTLVSAAADPQAAKEGVLGEVRALQPNHETRLEAIERAERARQLDLGNREEQEFKTELGNFVEEGKLKKSGGVEEAERLRKARDERLRKADWERQNGRSATDSASDASVPAVAPVETNKGENERPISKGESKRSASPEVFEEARERPGSRGSS